MRKEEYVKNLIARKGESTKAFAESVGLPYTTLLSMLSRGLGGASLSNVQKLCSGLSITVNDLLSVEDDGEKTEAFVFTEQEKQLVIRYREKPEMQAAVCALLDLK